MKKLLYFTVIPAQFQLEFIKECNECQNEFEIIPVFLSNITEERVTWGKVNHNNSINYEINSLITIWRKCKPDIVSICFYFSKFSWILRSLCKFNNIPYIYGPSEKLIKRNYLFQKIKEKILWLMLKDSRGVVGIGKGAVEEFKRICNKPTINIPYCFNLDKLLENENKIVDKIRFIYSGRLVDFRNPLFTIKIFRKIVDLYGDKVELIISGKGPLYNNCIKLISELKLNKYVIWDNDYKDWYDIHNLYKKGNILLALQKYSGWGLIIQEAMAAGLGVVGSKYMEAVNTLIDDGVNGFSVDIFNENEVISKICRYLDNPDLIIEHGTMAKKHIKNYDVRILARQYMDFVKTLFYL